MGEDWENNRGKTTSRDPFRPTPAHPLTSGFPNPVGQRARGGSFGTKEQWILVVYHQQALLQAMNPVGISIRIAASGSPVEMLAVHVK